MHGAPRRRAPARNFGGGCGARRGASSEPSSTTKAASAMGRRSGSTSFARCRRSSPRCACSARAAARDANNSRARGRRSAAALGQRYLLELPADVLGLVLYQLTLAHDIAAVAPTCHVLCDAAKLAMKLRPFSGEVVTLAGHGCCVAFRWHPTVASSPARTTAPSRCGATARACAPARHTPARQFGDDAAGRARFITGSDDHVVKLWTLDGALERTFATGSCVDLRRGAARRRALWWSA